MKKTLISTVLGMTLVSGPSIFGQNDYTNHLNYKKGDSREICISQSGEIQLPKIVCESFLNNPELLAKISYAYGMTPYKSETNKFGKIFFYDHRKNVTVLEGIITTNLKDTSKREIYISGERSFSDFKGYLEISLEENKEKTKYNSKMGILLENPITRVTIKGLKNLPIMGKKIEGIFIREQNFVIEKIGKLTEEIKKDSYQFIRTLENGTNGVTFSEEEIKETKKGLESFLNNN